TVLLPSRPTRFPSTTLFRSEPLRLVWAAFAVLLTACAPHVAPQVTPQVADRQTLPDAAWHYERLLIRASLAEFGTDRYVAAFGAQVEQESAWDCTARSRFADGCTQFTPATAKWFAETIGRDLGAAAPFDAGWALPARVRYMRWIHDRIDDVATPCDHWAMALAAYNGGPGWIERDRRLCAQNGCD